FPASEHFTQGFGFCSPLDLSQYDPQAMAELAMQDYSGIERQLRELGRASWYRYLKPETEVPQYMLQIAHDGYGKHELDAVITRPALVPDTDQPTLTLEHRCNVTDVLQRIYISSDHGLSWQPALTTDGSEAPMGGFILPHTRIELDLKPFIGEEVIVMFLLAADEGSEAQWNEFEWGWWLDVLSFGEDGWIDLPIAALEQPGEPVFGALTGSDLFSVRPANDNDLAVAHWWLDYPAFHVELPQDQRVSVSGIGPHGYSFDLSGSTPGNVETLLHLTVIDIHGNVSNELEIPAWRYDLAGDVNADGLVDAADTAALQQHLASGLPYMPFADCNFDGV